MTDTMRAHDDGFTLVELLVAMTVGLIVLAATLSFFVTGFRQTKAVDDRVDALDRASFGLERLRTELRTAIELRPAVGAAQDVNVLEARLWVPSGGGHAQHWVRFDCGGAACTRKDLTTGASTTMIEAVDPAGGAAFTLQPAVAPARNGTIQIHVRVQVKDTNHPILLEAAASPRPCADGLPSGATSCPG